MDDLNNRIRVASGMLVVGGDVLMIMFVAAQVLKMWIMVGCVR